MNAGSDRFRLRVRYTKQGKVRFISHRDLARVFERTFKKLRLPVAYSEGFSPRPKFSFGLALSVGHTSDAEYLDVELSTPVDVAVLPGELTAALPPGIEVVAVARLAPGATSLQEAIDACGWAIEVLNTSEADVASAASKLLTADELLFVRQRKGKTSEVDVRPALLELEVAGPTDRGVELRAVLATRPAAVRPAELIELLASQCGEVAEGEVRRTHQWTIVDGKRVEPLGDPAAATTRELEGVS